MVSRLPGLKNDQACNNGKEKSVLRGSGCSCGFRHVRGNSQAAETIEPRAAVEMSSQREKVRICHPKLFKG